MSVRYFSINQLSEMTGLDRATIKKRLVNIKPFSEEKRAIIYDIRDVGAILFTDKRDKDSVNKQLLEEQLGYEKARRQKIELENQKALGEVVPISEVARIVGSEYASVRSRILSIPSRCARDLSLESDPSMVKNRLDQEVTEALDELTADKIYEETYDEQSSENFEADSSEDSEGTAET